MSMLPQRPPVWSSWDSLQQGNKEHVKKEGTGGRKPKTINKNNMDWRRKPKTI